MKNKIPTLSFSLNPTAILERTKTVTRRLDIRPHVAVGNEVLAINSSKDEFINCLGVIKILSVDLVILKHITQDEVIKEGYPRLTPEKFIDMLTGIYAISDNVYVHRVEFDYV